MFSEPHWLILVVPLLWLLFKFRPDSNKIFFLRILLVSLLVLALAEPIVKITGKEGTIVVVADRSASMPLDQDRRIDECVNILMGNMPANSRLGLVSFTNKGKIEFSPTKNEPSALSASKNAEGSNLNEGLELAMSLIPDEMSGRILILSDGLWNGENPHPTAVAAANRGIVIDYRYFARENIDDLAISYLKAPPSLEPEEPFMLKAGIISPKAQEADIELLDKNKSIFKTKYLLKAGFNELSFNIQAPSNSIVKHVLKVTGPIADPVPENNAAQAISLVRGKKPVLVAALTKPSTLAGFLEKNKIRAVELLANEFSWQLEDLQGYSSVILEDVPAQSLGFSGMYNLSAWVKHLGGGLLTTGGKNSYGNGGYFNSPLADTLPLSLEMRSETRKMAIAIAVVLDRSGSMAMTTRGRTKMELANLAAASALDLLAPIDEFCLFAVDTQAHNILPLQSVNAKEEWRDRILRVQSQGGGIYVYEGIKAAFEMLKTAKAQTKHIILFSDATDSEQPGNYWELLAEAEKHDMTLSVIGLGRESDRDGNLLKKIAEAGRGRCFFTEEAEDLPRLFSQDTFLAAKSTFVKEKQNITSSLGLSSYVGRNMDFKSSVAAYNICYLKENASQIITNENEDRSPILALWQHGLGRVACYTGVLSEELGGDFLKTSFAPDIFSGITNWLCGDEENTLGELVATQRVENSRWSAYVNLDPERVRDPFKETPTFEILSSNKGGEPRRYSVKASWETADSLVASYDMKGNEVVSALLKTDKLGSLKLTPVCQIYSPEFLPQINRRGDEELKAIAKVTGGKELIDLNSIWENMPPVSRNKDISDWLFALALFIFLLEVAERRMALLTMIIAGCRALFKRASSPLPKEKPIDEEVKTPNEKTLTKAAPSFVAVLEDKPEIKKEEKRADVVSALKAAKKKATRRGV